MTKSAVLLLFSFLILLIVSCGEEQYDKDNATYLHIAHTRSYSEAKDQLMTAAETLDYSKYDVLMLGGDLVFESTGKPETLEYLDTVFDLSNPHTLWTLGNHDYHNHPEWIPETTGRPNAYAFQKYGITYLVFDSQEDNCNTSGKQKKLLEETLKSLKSGTTHLIVLHHKLLWMLDNGSLQGRVDAVANGGAGGCFHCIPQNDFYKEVYPKLVKVQKKGVQVICIAGDIGVKVNEFEYQTPEGIYFLASGLKDGGADNRVLLFQHDIKNKKLDWKFEKLSSLPQKINVKD
jgi:calcineurin-like phosphoesterase family protein